MVSEQRVSGLAGQSRLAAQRWLAVPFKVEDHRHDHAHSRVVKGSKHLMQGTWLKYQVGIEYAERATRASVAPTNVDSACIPEVRTGLDANHCRMITNSFDCVIGRAVVHDDDSQREPGGRGERGVQEGSDITRAVIGDDDDHAINVVWLICFSHCGLPGVLQSDFDSELFCFDGSVNPR
jgi:hypothetical protein